MHQGTETYTEADTWQIFSRMANIFEELFTPTLKGIAVSVWYVSSTSVVLHSRVGNQ